MFKPKDNINSKDIVLATNLNRIYSNMWKSNLPNEIPQLKVLELMITTKCTLACKYCYYNKRGSILHPDSITQEYTIQNLDNLFDFLLQNKLTPRQFAIFSGEPFDQELTYIIIDKLFDFYEKRPDGVDVSFNIPTGFTFINDETKIKRVESIINRAKELQIGFHLSCSVDGKFCDKNRPYKSGFIRDDEWYNKLFTFCKKHNVNFHPMVYFNELEYWEENLDWWYAMKDKYELDDIFLYLLEVRNPGWTKKDIHKFYKFSKYVTKTVLSKYSELSLADIIHSKVDCNWFGIFTGNQNAVSCGLESSLAIRLADMKIYPCHRLQYDEFEAGKLEFSPDNKDCYVSAKNIEMFIASSNVKHKDYPICQNCDINELCLGGCLGAQYEEMKDPFLPIPEVCALQHAKIKGIITGMKECNRYGEMIKNVSSEMAIQIKKIEGENNE